MIELHDYVQFFLVVILFFVLWFYVNIILDFGEFNTRHDPKFLVEKTYTHTKARNIAHIGWLEVVWTIIPIIILTAIAIPSFKLLYALDVVNSPLLTLRCIGNQWYWTYECDIIKPQVHENLQKYFTAGNLFKSNFIKLHFMGADNTMVLKALPFGLRIDAFRLIPGDIFEIRAKALNGANEAFITMTPYYTELQNNTLPESRQYTMRSVLKDSRVMNLNYMPSLAQHIFGKHYPQSIQIEELRNSLLDFVDIEYLNESKQHRIITQVEKYTNKFHIESESFAVDSYLLDVDDLQLGAFRLLEVDNFPKLPANAEIRLAVTGTDVIHSFAVPSLGVKIDAIPGRLNQFGIRVRVPGTYYGQCSELCGVGHGFMPIKVQFIKLIK